MTLLLQAETNTANTDNTKTLTSTSTTISSSSMSISAPTDTSVGPQHNAYMRAACDSALAGVNIKNGGPFGCSIVSSNRSFCPGQILSCRHNSVLKEKNPTRHAEMNAIRWACRLEGKRNLSAKNDTTILSESESSAILYTTCEQCPMCWAASLNAGIVTDQQYIGVDRVTAAEFGFNDAVFYDEMCNLSKEILGKNCVVAGSEVSDGTGVNNSSSVRESPFMTVQVINSGTNDNSIENLNSKDSIITKANKIDPPLSFDINSIDLDVLKQLITTANNPIGIHDDCLLYHVERKKIVSDVALGNSGSTEIPTNSINLPIGKDTESIDATVDFITSAVERACKTLDTHVLKGVVAIVTKQPTVMGTAALLWGNVEMMVVVDNVNNDKFSEDSDSKEFKFQTNLWHRFVEEQKTPPKTIKKVMYEECKQVFRTWQKVNGIIY